MVAKLYSSSREPGSFRNLQPGPPNSYTMIRPPARRNCQATPLSCKLQARSDSCAFWFQCVLASASRNGGRCGQRAANHLAEKVWDREFEVAVFCRADRLITHGSMGYHQIRRVAPAWRGTEDWQRGHRGRRFSLAATAFDSSCPRRPSSNIRDHSAWHLGAVNGRLHCSRHIPGEK